MSTDPIDPNPKPRHSPATVRGLCLEIEFMTLRTLARAMEIPRPYPWKFDRTRYEDNFLVQQPSESDVQNSIIAELETFRVDVVHVDAGGAVDRGRIRRQMAARGIDISTAMNFKTVGIPAGWSDLHATLAPDGVGLFIECKAPAWIEPGNPRKIIREAGTATTEQLVFLDSKHKRGAICLVAWSVDDVTKHIGDRLVRNLQALR